MSLNDAKSPIQLKIAMKLKGYELLRFVSEYGATAPLPTAEENSAFQFIMNRSFESDLFSESVEQSE